MGTTTALLTFEEFERLPDAEGKRELLDGELIELPPANKEHSTVTKRVFKILDAAAPPGMEAFLEAGFRLGPRHWLAPDVSVVTGEQRAASEDNEYFVGAPVLAIEVLSPSNLALEIAAKTESYLANGSREVWVVNPRTRRISVHRAGESHIDVYDRELTSNLFPGLRVDIPSLFA